MKKRNLLILSSALVLIVCIVLAVIFFPKGTKPKANNNSPDTSSMSEVTVPDLEQSSGDNATKYSGEDNFIEPDETEADRLLQEKRKKAEAQTKNINSLAPTQPKPINEPANPEKSQAPTESKQQDSAGDAESKAFYEGKAELKKQADEYLRAHNIDSKTAGETGKICPHCGQKIWNPDKYGFYIPGIPEDFENSGYCLGTCGIAIY